MRFTAPIAAAVLAYTQVATAAAPEKPAVQAKNVIYIVPDGYGQASQSLARDLYSLVETGSTASKPEIVSLAADELVAGLVQTWAANNLITDSAASGTAFAAGFKSNNGAISVLPDGKPVGSILEAAKAAGMRTALVVTSTINHATPAVYASHTESRGSLDTIANQEIGYSHPLGRQADILFGGGRCSFYPKGHKDSCRSDSVDLWKYAEDEGYYIARNLTGFEALEDGLTNVPFPWLGLFNDGDLRYEIDRKVTKDEPSLLDMVKTALNRLDKATSCREKGYFIMIEASRIDHAGHANDAAAHAVDTLMYNTVMDHVRGWIDEHPDTIMMSAADHECGGLTLNGFNPISLSKATHSGEYMQELWDGRPSGADRRQFLVSEILPAAGLSDASNAEINTILEASSVSSEVLRLQARRAGINWSTGGHTGSDITLFGYAAEEQRRALQADLSGVWDNTQLPRYIEKVLGVDMDAITDELRAAADEDSSWLGKRGLEARMLNEETQCHH
ncbi:alkaline phosphatase domain-containing protein [Sarocladium implicatum]|nr:alkaline phosphatase domain-containing protein [Sarocladium implicatum]